MKKTIKLLIILFSINVASAQTICDPGCAINFVFNSGGSITATDAMSFTYVSGSEISLGETGTINTAVQPESLDFNAGGVLSLAAGESITFDAGGFFNLEQGSDLSSFGFTLTGGDVSIVAGADPSTITIHGTLSTDGLLTIVSPEVTINDDITAGSGVSISSGDILNGTIISGTGNIIIDTSSTITINGSIIENTGSLSVNEISTTGTITGQVRVLDDLSGLQGMELPTVDGASCIVTANECIAGNGDIYVLTEGELVKQEAATGSFSMGSLLALSIYSLLLLSRRFKIS